MSEKVDKFVNDEPPFLRDFLYIEQSDLLNCALFGVFSAVLLLVFPIGVQTLVNSIAFTGLLQPIFILSAVVALILLGAYASTIFQTITVEKMQRRLYTRAAYGMMDFDLSQDNIDQYKLSRFLEIYSIQKNLAGLVIEGMTLVLQLLTGILLLAFYHPALFVFGLVLALSVFAAIWSFKRAATRTAREESNSKFKLIDYFLTEHPVNPGQVDQSSEEYLMRRRSHFRLLLSQTVLIYGIAVVAVTSLLGLGGYLVVEGQLSLGQLVAAELVVGMISISLAKLPKQLEGVYDLSISLEKLSSVYRASRNYDKQMKSLFQKYRIRAMQTGGTLRWLVAVFGLVAMGILFLPWVQTTFGTGKVAALDPRQRPQNVEATVEGRIVDWLVKEGDEVKKGQVLVELEDLDPQAIDRLETQRKNYLKQLKAIEVARETASKNLKRQIELNKEGVVANRSLELARNELAKATKEEASVFGKLAELDTKIARQRAQTVVAPVDGFVSTVFRGLGGEVVKKGEPLVTLIPEVSSRVVEIWVDGNDAPLVFPGRTARLQFEGWPAVQFSGWPGLALGTFEGRVRMVDWADDGNGMFRILIEEAKPGSWPSADLLRQGVRVIAWVLLEEVTVGYELWRKMNGFPPIRDIPDSKELKPEGLGSRIPASYKQK